MCRKDIYVNFDGMIVRLVSLDNVTVESGDGLSARVVVAGNENKVEGDSKGNDQKTHEREPEYLRGEHERSFLEVFCFCVAFPSAKKK